MKPLRWKIQFNKRWAQHLFAFTLTVPNTMPNIEIRGFRLVESEKQKRTLELIATEADIFKKQQLAGLTQLRAFIWNDSNQPIEAIGKAAVLDMKSENFEIQNDAVLNSPDGYSFESPNLFYHSKSMQFSTEEKVKGFQSGPSKKKATFSLTGTGLTADLKAKTYEIHNAVRAKQLVSKSDELNINSSSTFIEPEKNSATFYKNVTVKSSTLDMKGDKMVATFGKDKTGSESYLKYINLSATRMNSKIFAKLKGLDLQSKGLNTEFLSDGTIKFSEATGDIEAVGEDGIKIKSERLINETYKGRNRILIDGQVQITTKDRLATCQEAIYFPDTGDITLLKVASIKNDSEILYGDVIRFSTKNSEIKVEKARGQLSGKPNSTRPSSTNP